MFSSYGMNASQLPLASSDPFKEIRYDVKGMCDSYSRLRHCYNDADCINYNTFHSIFSSEIDAVYYVSETAFLEFYCDYGVDFFVYDECLEVIEMDDLSDVLYTECTEVQVRSCDSVSRNTQCERAIIRKSCGNHAVRSYCQYQKILTRMTGWNYCEYMPCVNSSLSTNSLMLILILISVTT